jgi:hypothetical protein
MLAAVLVLAASASAMKVLEDASMDSRISKRDVFEECGRNWLEYNGLHLEVKLPPQGIQVGKEASFTVEEASGLPCTAEDYTLWVSWVSNGSAPSA